MMTPEQRRRQTHISMLIIAMCVLGLLWIGTRDADSSDTPVDLEALYPGDTDTYLEGNNWVTGEPQRSVLWFRQRIRGYWSQYNWAPDDPQADCNEDRFRWYRGELRYLWTDTECDGQDVRTRYRPAVVYMPSTWTPGETWERCGTSTVTHTDHGTVVRSGVTGWCATVAGVVDLQPGRPAVQIDVRLTTVWDGEPASHTTRWIETLYVDPETGLARDVGGNLDGGWNWDVWFLPERQEMP